eukprot:7532811-Alexandrium_andersonii.AAC.1
MTFRSFRSPARLTWCVGHTNQEGPARVRASSQASPHPPATEPQQHRRAFRAPGGDPGVQGSGSTRGEEEGDSRSTAGATVLL